MRKIILAAALILTISTLQANAHTPVCETGIITLNNNAPIPQACVDSYNAMYPGATTLKWARKGEGVYQVTFIYNGQKMTARYSASGVYLGK
ncbi:hypothetical protein I5907_18345 [Panacibacter sp. DH6]|uniref:DUF2845 domain-containing protein n=1 Tax=Panacibacter microcysteis TaxID=2793269 RepID=A0A931GZH7_9BACT|nr:hypothetical protein [Panacibacter microcysteis]MBG9378205.1 hypothetical protein [Panacibacter microcysteis]